MSSLRGSGPDPVPEPQVGVVAPKGTWDSSPAQGWDGQSGAFPPAVEMGPLVDTNPAPSLGSSLPSGRKDKTPQTGLFGEGAAPAPPLPEVTLSEAKAGSRT